MSFHEMACTVARAFFGEDIPTSDLDAIVCDTLSFPTPVAEVEPGIYSLELFHGPTLAFKDVGARFMARLLQYFISRGNDRRNVHACGHERRYRFGRSQRFPWRGWHQRPCACGHERRYRFGRSQRFPLAWMASTSMCSIPRAK